MREDIPVIKKKTRIVCTLGPSTDTDEMVGKLMDAGIMASRRTGPVHSHTRIH